MKISILGTGAYGLALALSLNKGNNEISMWTKLEQEKEEITTKHSYEKVLPNVIISQSIKVTTNIQEAIKEKELIIIAIPANFVASVSNELKDYITPNQHICIATKGIEQNSCLFMDQIITNIINTNNISVISGPSFAIDTVSDNPIGLNLASTNDKTIEIVKEAFHNTNIKLMVNNDILGTELCGSIKNIYAIACGILDGLNTNESTTSMFLTKAILNLQKLITDLGGNNETVLSYAGFGDLILTCTSTKSRNYTLGKLIATSDNKTINEYKENNTIEGLYTLKSIIQLITKYNIKSKLIEIINNIVYENHNPQILIAFLFDKNN